MSKDQVSNNCLDCGEALDPMDFWTSFNKNGKYIYHCSACMGGDKQRIEKCFECGKDRDYSSKSLHIKKVDGVYKYCCSKRCMRKQINGSEKI